MKIRLLNKDVIYSEEFYQDFLNGQVKEKEEYFSEEEVIIDQAPDFPIYLNIKNEEMRKLKFLEAFRVIAQAYIGTEREIHFNDIFWYSLFTTQKREYLLQEYPEIKNDIKTFHNIVLKKFDWENYVYKCVLAVQYVTDNFKDQEKQEKYYHLILDNLDVYNYIIKYEIFRNDLFLIKILYIIDKHQLSTRLKAKIKDRDDLGADERVGRRVILELNKMYPVVIAPAMDKEDLEILFLEILKQYE